MKIVQGPVRANNGFKQENTLLFMGAGNEFFIPN